MKVFKDILQVLKIETVYLVKDGNMHMCMPFDITETKWKVSCDSGFLTGNVILKIKFNGSFIFFDVQIKQFEQDSLHSFIYELNIPVEEYKKDNMNYLFYMMTTELMEENNEWNKRSEERYDIGLDQVKIDTIGFKDPEQKIIFEKKQLPCMVNNISFSGAKITTMEDFFQTDKKVCIYYSFVNPIEQIPVIGTIRNCFIKTLKNNQNVSVISLQYDEVPYAYKKRLESFIDKTGDKS